MNKTEYVERACKVHGLKYDYSKMEYINMKTKITIICPEHGEFEQLASNHLYLKQNCPKCSRKNYGRKKRTTEQFIERAREIHGLKYDYSKVVYEGSRAKITIICSICGKEFEQVAQKHLDQGHSCKRHYYDIERDLNQLLYDVHVEDICLEDIYDE